jgi:hypothetical protein
MPNPACFGITVLRRVGVEWNEYSATIKPSAGDLGPDAVVTSYRSNDWWLHLCCGHLPSTDRYLPL